MAALKSHVVALREANGKLVSDMESLKEANKGLQDQVAELTNQVLDTDDQDAPPSERDLLTVSQSYGVQDSFPGASPRGESILDGDTEDADATVDVTNSTVGLEDTTAEIDTTGSSGHGSATGSSSSGERTLNLDWQHNFYSPLGKVGKIFMYSENQIVYDHISNFIYFRMVTEAPCMIRFCMPACSRISD